MARTALLVVHLQADIVEPSGAFGALFAPEIARRDTLHHCAEAARRVRQAGGLVVWLRIALAEGYTDSNPRIPLLGMAEQAGCLVEGTPGAEIVSGVGAEGDDLVVTHARPGPFTGSGLAEQLRAAGVTAVAVCGVATNASVEGAVRQAADLDFETHVVEDACSAADEAAHAASIASMGLLASVITVDQLPL